MQVAANNRRQATLAAVRNLRGRVLQIEIEELRLRERQLHLQIQHRQLKEQEAAAIAEDDEAKQEFVNALRAVSSISIWIMRVNC